MESLGTGRNGAGIGRKGQEEAFPLPAPVPSDSIAGDGGARGKGSFYPFTLLPFYPLFMVVRFTFYNSTCAIERLGKDKAHHLMREGHLGEGNLLVGAVVDRR